MRRFARLLLPIFALIAVAAFPGGDAFGQLEALMPGVNGEAETPADEPPEPAVAEPMLVPDSLLSPRATLGHFLGNMNAGEYAAAAECLDMTSKDRASRGKDLAYNLKAVLDRLEEVDIEKIPDDANFQQDGQNVWQFPHEPNIQIAKDAAGAWRFTPETVAAIDKLYAMHKSEKVISGGNWLRNLFPEKLTEEALLLPWYQWICLIIVILIGVLADAIVRFMLHRAAETWFKVAKVKVDKKLERSVWKPVGLLTRALTWYVGTLLIGLPPLVLDILLIAVQFFAVIVGIWTAFRMIDLLANYLLSKAQRTRTKFDDLFIPLVSRSLKIFATCVGIISLAQTFGWPIAGLLGGLGLGGAALALASKDSVANVFGSITVLVDRPFEIGDWIVTEGVEGSVEAVGMRSTRVRTFYNSLISVPNSRLITAVVDNMGKRRYRRIKTTLGLQYDTPPDRIDAFCEGIRELIRRHPYTRKDYYHVYFNQFSGSSLGVLLYCFLECPDWSVELRERHRLFVDILRLADQLGVSFAFPTQTLHMFQEKAPAADGSYFHEPLDAGRQTAASITGQPLSASERPGLVEFPGPYQDEQHSGPTPEDEIE